MTTVGAVQGRAMADATLAAQRSRIRALADGVRGWLLGAPANVVLAVLVLVVGSVAQLVPGRLAEWAVSPSRPAHMWSLVTGVLWSSGWMTMLGAVVLALTVGAWAERAVGPVRYLVAGLASTIVGVLVVQATHPLSSLTSGPWADHLSAARVGTGGALVLGAFAAASATFDALWRRRVRTLLFVSVATVVAFGGGAGDLIALAASLVGLLGGHLWWRRRAPHRSLVGTRQDARTIIAVIVVAVTLGTLLSAWSTFPVGPLAAARFGLEPESLDAQTIAALCADPDTVRECARATYVVRTRGLGPTILAALPLVVQLVLAGGLRSGRRAAALGTIALQLLAATLAALHLVAAWTLARATGDTSVPLGLGTHGVPGPRLVLPILVPVAVALLVLLGRRAFVVRTRPGTFRRAAALVAATAITAFGVMLAFGSLVDEQFAPAASVPVLAADFAVRLLPSGALALLTPTLEPSTPLAVAIADGSPIAVWAVGALALWLALRGTPATRAGERSALADLVRSEGAGTLGWMLTWTGRDVWLAEDGRSGVAYRAGQGVALTVTDPAAAPDALRAAIIEFSTFAASHSLVPALYSVHAPVADVARDLGWTTIQVAEEAVLDLPTLSFKGKAFQDVRTALNRATKEGVRAEWTTWATCPAGRRDQIAAIGTAAMGEKSLPEMGFTLGGLAELADEDTRLLLAIDADATVQGVTSWMPVHRDGAVVGLTLDVMWRREGGFRPVMDFLIASAALDAQREGLEVLSLSGTPLARTQPEGATADAPGSTSSRLEAVLDVLGGLLEPAYGFRSLLAYKKKFGPRLVPLHLAVPDLMDAPAVGLAVARAYLPDLTPADTARFAQKLVARD